MSAGSLQTGLDGPLRNAEHGGGFSSGQAVDGGENEHRSKVRVEILDRGTECTVPSLAEEFFLEADDAAGDSVAADRVGVDGCWSLFAELIDEAPDGNAPDPRPDVAVASVLLGRLPHGNERVLHRDVDQIRVTAATLQAPGEPLRMPVVELFEGAAVASSDTGDQRGVFAPYRITARRRSSGHTPPVGSTRPIGSFLTEKNPTAPLPTMKSMDLIEFENEKHLSREEAAKWLHQLADTLGRHNEVEFVQEGLKYRVKVPKMIDMEVELEIDDDGTKVEIELSW